MKFDFKQVRLQEDFVFGSVMSDPKLCLKLIRLILPQLSIEHVEMVDRQKVVEDSYHSHGVRFDIYTRDDQQNVYNIEMQVQNTRALPQRARYYHGRMDSDNLRQSQDYRLLKPSYVIFICLFDPFGLGLHKYEFNHLCSADHSLSLNNGQTTIFLNAKGIANDVNSGLVKFLDFVDNKEVEDEYVNEIKLKIDQCTNQEKWRQEYMDNKTHMLFHDIDIEEVTREKTRKEMGNEYSRIIQEIFRCLAADMSQDEIVEQLQSKFTLTSEEIKKVLPPRNFCN